MIRQQINFANWRTIHAPKEFHFTMGTTPTSTTYGSSSAKFGHHRARLHRNMPTNWQPSNGTKYILKTGSKFMVTTPIIQNTKEIYNNSYNMTRQQTPYYMHHKVFTHPTNTTEYWKHQQVTRCNHRTHLMTDTPKTTTQQKAMTKFIIGLQPQTTTQRFTSTLGKQRTRV